MNFFLSRRLSIVPVLIVFVMLSCKNSNAHVDEGSIVENTYVSKEIGWSLEIPEGWSIMEKDDLVENSNKGKKAFEETLNQEVDYSTLRHLISFQKNPFNVFLSTSEPFDLEYDGEWEINNDGLKEILYMTYENQGIRVDSTATTIERIDGLDFRRYSFIIYSPNDEVILNQIIYSRLINGFDFGVIINYNNEEYKEVMLNAFRNSRFRKRK